MSHREQGDGEGILLQREAMGFEIRQMWFGILALPHGNLIAASNHFKLFEIPYHFANGSKIIPSSWEWENW